MKISKAVSSFLAFLVLFLCFLASGCDFYTIYEYDDYQNYITMQNEFENINIVDIDWLKGKINIQKSQNDKLSISETIMEDDKDKLHTLISSELDQTKVYIKFCESGQKDVSIEKELNIFITDNVDELIINCTNTILALNNITIDNITIDVDSGNANICNVITNKLIFTTLSANLTINNSQINTATTTSISGNIKIEDGEYQTLDVTTITGNIKTVGNIPNIDCESYSGEIILTTSDLSPTVSLISKNGDITANINANAQFTLIATAQTGNMINNFTMETIGDIQTYNDGQNIIKLITQNGNITLNKTIE